MTSPADQILKQLQSQKGLDLLFLKTGFSHLTKWIEAEKPDAELYYQAKLEVLIKLANIEVNYIAPKA